jgi:Tfp pilus assembly protein PilF
MGAMEVDAESCFFEGTRHLLAGEFEQAKTYFQEAIRLAPDFSEAHANLAFLLDQAGLKTEAEKHYQYAIVCNPTIGQTYLNLGVLLTEQKRFAEAEAAYRSALNLNPQSAVAWSNLGVLQACRKQEKEAEESYLKAIELDADYQLAQFNYSYLLLRQGRYEAGWRCFEARNWYAKLEKYLALPRWHGEPLAGKSVLIGIEAGHGDMIQFCRYASLLKAQGAAKIGIICHPALKTLFLTLDSVDCVIALDQPLPSVHWDCWTPPLSIAFYCQTRVNSIPATLPYLKTDRKKCEFWATKMRDFTELRVGLVWKGSSNFENDADRSLPSLGILAPLASLAGVHFFSLQKGAGEAEADHPPHGMTLLNWGPQIFDFSDTAALVENLDLVISVDTAVAHLAGALGKTCWILLPDYKTDWRWLTGRSDSPWYPGAVRLFRQPRMGDWASVVAEVHTALQTIQLSHRLGYPHG